MKKISLLLVFVMLFSFTFVNVSAADTVTMYAVDGRTISVPSEQTEAYSVYGWYYVPVRQLYAVDGRTLVVPTNQIEAYKAYGWYEVPVTLLYALDGRTMVVPSSEADAYYVYGWYYQPMTEMYALDGRTIVVPTSQVEAYKLVGWYTTPQKINLPFNGTMNLWFSSGAGAWGTDLELNNDGSFVGSYHDSNMGETGYGYPHGTVYICNFNGKFSNIKRVNDYTYTMTLERMNIKEIDGSRWISDKILYIASVPYGLEEGREYVFYTPNAPIGIMDEEFLSWWPGRWSGKKYNTLSCYGLYNKAMGYGFFDGFDY